MTVQPSGTNPDWLTDKLRNIGFSEQSQIDVQSMQLYEVHAIAVWSDAVFFQIIGDSGVISWMPSGAFKVVDHSMPRDWIANMIDEEVSLIIGPDFVARDKEAYADMVELDSEKVRLFHHRLEKRKLSDSLP